MKYIILLVLLSCKTKEHQVFVYNYEPPLTVKWEWHNTIPYGYEPQGYSISAWSNGRDTFCTDSYGDLTVDKWVILQHKFDSIRYANYDGYNMRQYDSLQKGIKLIDSIGIHHQILYK